VQTKFKDLLHQYKLEVFHRQHDKKNVEEITTECMHITDDVLKSKYHYHFKQLPSADRAEVINMINSYTREAILPPVIAVQPVTASKFKEPPTGTLGCSNDPFTSRFIGGGGSGGTASPAE